MPRVWVSDSAELAYDRKGKGRSVVLLHDAAVSRTSWSPVFELLAARFDVAAFDLRGHGESTSAVDAGVESLAADLKIALENLRIERPLLVGMGLGASVAFQLSSRRVPRGVIALEPAFDAATLALLERFEAPLLELTKTEPGTTSRKSLTAAHAATTVEVWPELAPNLAPVAERLVARLGEFDDPLQA